MNPRYIYDIVVYAAMLIWLWVAAPWLWHRFVKPVVRAVAEWFERVADILRHPARRRVAADLAYAELISQPPGEWVTGLRAADLKTDGDDMWTQAELDAGMGDLFYETEKLIAQLERELLASQRSASKAYHRAR